MKRRSLRRSNMLQTLLIDSCCQTSVVADALERPPFVTFHCQVASGRGDDRRGRLTVPPAKSTLLVHNPMTRSSMSSNRELPPYEMPEKTGLLRLVRMLELDKALVGVGERSSCT